MPASKKTPSKSRGKKDDSKKVQANEGEQRQPGASKPAQDSFPIVGIGASAGGVQAPDTFFAHMPSGCRMAFVIVQHLDPHHNSMMDSLLAKETPLQVIDAADGVRVRPGRLYRQPDRGRIRLPRGGAALGRCRPLHRSRGVWQRQRKALQEDLLKAPR